MNAHKLSKQANRLRRINRRVLCLTQAEQERLGFTSGSAPAWYVRGLMLMKAEAERAFAAYHREIGR